jgi:hypothetical protein
LLPFAAHHALVFHANTTYANRTYMGQLELRLQQSTLVMTEMMPDAVVALQNLCLKE